MKIIINLMGATDMAAWIGAIGTMLLTLLEIYKHLSNKPRIGFKISYNQEILEVDAKGNTRKVKPGVFWSVKIINFGSKEMVVDSFSFSRFGTNKEAILARDFSGPITQYKLKPERNHLYIVPNNLVKFYSLREIRIISSTGKIYRKKVNNYLTYLWHKHIKK